MDWEGVAGGGGFEPPLAEPKSAVLPLDDPPRFVGKMFGSSVKIITVGLMDCKFFVKTRAFGQSVNSAGVGATGPNRSFRSSTVCE